MRKIIYILAAAAAMVSCENLVGEYGVGKEDMLILNSLMDADLPRQYIFVDMSGDNKTSRVENAYVTYSVNGGEARRAMPVTAGGFRYYDSQEKCYCMDAPVKPGDKIRVEAIMNTLSVYSETEVPEPVAGIVSVDTSYVRTDDSEGMDNYINDLRFKVRLRDRKGVNDYYRLDMLMHVRFVSKDGTEIVCEDPVVYDVDASDDPLINGGNTEASEEIFDISSSNDLNVFTDDMFADGDYVLTFNLPMNNMYWHMFRYVEKYGAERGLWDGYPSGDMYVDADVRIHTLPFMQYLYYMAVQAEDSIELLTEPAIYPENVSGGLGFVSASSSTDYRISFPVWRYEGVYY